MTPCQVAFAVSAWSRLTAFAPRVRRSENAVMSNGRRVALDAQPERQQRVHRDAAGVRAPVALQQRRRDPPDEVRVEPLVARRDRGVDREHRVATGPRSTRRRAVRPGRDELPRALGEQERGVALVEVPDRGREVELAQRPDAADAEDELLVEAHLAAADVQDVGDRAVRVVVVGDVGVEQQDRHPADLGDPDGGVQVAAGERHADGERLAQPVERPQDRQPRELVVRVRVLLVAVRVDRLAEVALAVHQPHADERQGHVRGGLHVVAGEDAEAAGVDPEALVEAVLGAEVRDRALELVAVAAGEPVVRAVRHVGVELAQDLLVVGHERRVVEELVPGDRTRQDGDRVAVAGPGAGVDPAEQHAGRAGATTTTGCRRVAAALRASAAGGMTRRAPRERERGAP